MLGKLFQQGTIAKHCVRKIKSVVDEILRRNLLLSDKIAELHFCDCEDEWFGIDGGRLVLGLFHILSM